MMESNKRNVRRLVLLVLVAIIGYWSINNLTTIGNLLSGIFNIIFPFILGGCLAFILNIPMSFFERKILNNKNKNSKKVKNKKRARVISIIFAILVIILVLAIIITLIVPELINVINMLIDNLPYYISETLELVNEYGANISDVNNLIKESNVDIENIKNQIMNQLLQILTSSISIVGSIISGITTFFIAIVFAIYTLIEKEKLKMQVTKILYAYFDKEKVEKIINIGRITKNTFKSFLTVQCLEASILGTLCMIGMLILKIPYAVPIGVFIGVTALIPVVGAFLGVIIGAILIVAVNPIKVITFVVFVLILQQIEGNVIYPRVVGNSIGLPGMWVLVAVSIGGSIGGIFGMLLGVPIATIIYTLLKANVNEKIRQKESIKEIL